MNLFSSFLKFPRLKSDVHLADRFFFFSCQNSGFYFYQFIFFNGFRDIF